MEPTVGLDSVAELRFINRDSSGIVSFLIQYEYCAENWIDPASRGFLKGLTMAC